MTNSTVPTYVLTKYRVPGKYTIISSRQIQNKTGRVRDESNDESDEDKEEEEFGLPNYSHPEGMNHTSV